MFLISQLAPQPKPMESDKAYWSCHPKLVEDFRVSSDVPLGLTIMTREVRREGGRGGSEGERKGIMQIVWVEDEVIQGEVPHDLFLI